MYVKKFHSIFSVSFVLFFLTNCANIIAPTGGPIDRKPPTLIKTFPDSNQLNFKDKTIMLEFDEYIDVSNLYEQLIISPYTDVHYNVTTRKKKLIIKFDNQLKENTTYNIFFGESIRDVTEGNIKKNLNITFSTGSIIDSSYISGEVYQFPNNTSMSNISVCLYSADDSINIKKNKPIYYTKTNELGKFKLSYLKPGKYLIYGHKDENKNYIYDNESELISIPETLNLDTNLTQLRIVCTKFDTKPPKITNKKSFAEYSIIKFDEGIMNHYITVDSDTFLTKINEFGNTITVFNTNYYKDTVNATLYVSDSLNNSKKEIIKLYFNYNIKKSEPLTISAKTKGQYILPGNDILFEINLPLKSLNTELIDIYADSVKINTKQKIDYNEKKMLLKIKNNSSFKDTLKIRFKKGCMISYNEDTLKNIEFNYLNDQLTNYGTIKGKIIVDSTIKNYIIQLVNSTGRNIYSEKNIKEFFYKNLSPGIYTLKAIIDENDNGIWDCGDFQKKLPPEKIIYYNNQINVRENWDITDLTFNIR
ncbi:MAG: Ig-like domain-containing protein [Cytophagaceae bacterium]|nr:Ig-like domain-containing protein [Cytophagaceae bacterium]MDW8456918.1 Ig-like domain-containing protein [Cytophagaceae bacterium]